MWIILIFLSWIHSQAAIVTANLRKSSNWTIGRLPRRESICLYADDSRLRSFSCLTEGRDLAWSVLYYLQMSSIWNTCSGYLMYLSFPGWKVLLFAKHLSIDWNNFGRWRGIERSLPKSSCNGTLWIGRPPVRWVTADHTSLWCWSERHLK